MVDYDAEVLKLAAKSADANAAAAADATAAAADDDAEDFGKVSTAVLDWTDAEAWPVGEYDVVRTPVGRPLTHHIKPPPP